MQFEAYSIAHSAIFYLSPLRNLWSGVTSKVGRALGRGNDVAVAKLIRMTFFVSLLVRIASSLPCSAHCCFNR